jgi:hypothetical protein
MHTAISMSVLGVAHRSGGLLRSADLMTAIEQEDERVKGCRKINYRAVNHSCRGSALIHFALFP